MPMSPYRELCDTNCPAFADVEGEGAEDGHGPEGHDEGSDAALGDQDAVEEARGRPEGQRDGPGRDYGPDPAPKGVEHEDGDGAV